jgi:RNA polymerase sigma-70 factor (ECF subfamily)
MMLQQQFRWLRRGVLAPLALVFGGVGSVAPTSAAPAPKPETPSTVDALDRIKLDNVVALLKSETIQKDVGLTDEQKKKIDEVRTEAVEKMKNELNQQLKGALPPGVAVGGGGIAIAGPGNIVVRNNGFDPFGSNAEVNQAIIAQLKPEQIRRLKQLTIQTNAPSMLLDRRVIRALGLTADQEDKIDTVLTKETKVEAITIQPGAQLAEQLAEKRAEAQDKQLAEALKVLSKDQRDAWDKLIGKALPTKELLLANPGAGMLGGRSISIQGGAMPAIRIAPQPGIALPALPIAPPVAPPAPPK